MANHEPICKAANMDPVDVYCRKCKFTGSEFIEIIMHMRRVHLQQALFEGTKTVFSITVDQKISRLYFLEDGIFSMHVEYNRPSLCLFIYIECLTVVKPRLFSIKIARPDDPSNYLLLQSNNGLDRNLVVIQKNYDHLNEAFGMSTVLTYELIVENLDFSLEEYPLILKYFELRKAELDYENNQQRINSLTDLQQEKIDVLKTSLDVLKYISPNILKCTNCDSLNSGVELYVCSEGHICCRPCLHPKCEACKRPREFRSVCDLQKLEMNCDWPGCKDAIDLHSYISHKATCSFRTYYCPLKGCYTFLTSIQELADHWHACTPRLIESDCSVTFNRGTHQTLFWVFHQDIYRVLAYINGKIQIIVEDFDVVLVNSKIYCYGIKGKVKEEIPSSIICGYFQVSIDNRQAENPDQFVYEKVEVEIVKK